MADTLTGITEVTNVSNAKIANLVQTYLIQESKLLPLITDYSALATPGSKSLGLPRSGGFTVGSKAENTSVEAQSVTYAADTISFNLHKTIQFLVEKFAERAAQPGIVSDMLMKAGKDMALEIDKIIAAQLLAGPSTSSPDHVIDFNDGTNDDLELADILNMRALLQAQNIEPQECFIGIHPAKESDILQIDNFIDASKWGSNEPISNGIIGKIYGLRVVVSNVFESDSVLAWHPSCLGFAFAQGISLDSEKDLANLATRYSLDFICGCTGGLDSGKRQVLIEPVA